MSLTRFNAALPRLVEELCKHLEDDDHRKVMRQLLTWTMARQSKGKIFAHEIAGVLWGENSDRPNPSGADDRSVDS
jgi:hypothetical protein